MLEKNIEVVLLEDVGLFKKGDRFRVVEFFPDDKTAFSAKLISDTKQPTMTTLTEDLVEVMQSESKHKLVALICGVNNDGSMTSPKKLIELNEHSKVGRLFEEHVGDSQTEVVQILKIRKEAE